MRTLLVENNDTKLFVSLRPKEGTETIILLHGGPGVPDNLTLVAESLTNHFQVLNFHQRGTGLSPCPDNDYSIGSYISDIDCLAQHFSLGKFHLFGHSWGGLYAQLYAQKSPSNVSSLFLCSPSSGTGKHWKETENEVFQFNRSKCSLSEFLGLGFNNLLGMFGNDRAYQSLFKQVIINYNKGFNMEGLMSFDLQHVKADPINKTRKHILNYPVLEKDPGFNFKVTITYGDNDIYGESKHHLNERYPSGKFYTIEKCGHLPWLHNRSAFDKILRNHYEI